MIVVADTSPLNYLVQIQCEHVLPRLYRAVVIPLSVIEELRSPKAPSAVKAWIERLPDWLEIHPLASAPNPELNHLGRGEREAIQLAEEQRASLLLIDERKGQSEAARRGLSTTGTLGCPSRCRRSRLNRPSAGVPAVNRRDDLPHVASLGNSLPSPVPSVAIRPINFLPLSQTTSKSHLYR
jgi:predicted nucleic acid-binding protein